MKKKKTVEFKNQKIKRTEIDWWDDISDAEKASILRGLEDVKAGRVLSHEVVMKKYMKWLEK
jgi:predicted transcriptional regulator